MRPDGAFKPKRFEGLGNERSVVACGEIFVEGFARLRKGGTQHLFKPFIITIRRFSNEQYGRIDFGGRLKGSGRNVQDDVGLAYALRNDTEGSESSLSR